MTKFLLITVSISELECHARSFSQLVLCFNSTGQSQSSRPWSSPTVKTQEYLKDTDDYFINLTEDLMPPKPCYWSRAMRSVWNQTWENGRCESTKCWCSRCSPLAFADTEVTEAMGPVNQTATQSMQRLQSSVRGDCFSLRPRYHSEALPSLN